MLIKKIMIIKRCWFVSLLTGLIILMLGICQQVQSSAIIDFVDEELGIAKAHFGSHDLLITSGDHGHPAHWSWVDPTPPSSLTTVTYFVHSHGGVNALSVDQIARISDAAEVWNTSGALVALSEVASDSIADVHVHGDGASGCGGGAIGCAEFTYFLAHNPLGYTDGHPQHEMASNQGFTQELTMLRRTDWYTGSDPSGIGGSELDYMSVAIQEFGHHLGLSHNDSTTGHPLAEFNISPMNGVLQFGVTRRVLQSSDIDAITHLYGAAEPIPEPTTIALFGIGLAGMGGRYIRKKINGKNKP